VLRLRDRGCAFPGCERRRHTNAHPIEHWADGGAPPTSTRWSSSAATTTG
jgi:hypothetical protein